MKKSPIERTEAAFGYLLAKFRSALRNARKGIRGPAPSRVGAERLGTQATAVPVPTELEVATSFLMGFLLAQPTLLTKRQLRKFRAAFPSVLWRRYRNRWLPDAPLKWSGFRRIHVGNTLDPLVDQAAEDSSIPSALLLQALPKNLTLWIDPSEVSYCIGENSVVRYLYQECPDPAEVFTSQIGTRGLFGAAGKGTEIQKDAGSGREAPSGRLRSSEKPAGRLQLAVEITRQVCCATLTFIKYVVCFFSGFNPNQNHEGPPDVHRSQGLAPVYQAVLRLVWRKN
jgi:hypothetical protein